MPSAGGEGLPRCGLQETVDSSTTVHTLCICFLHTSLIHDCIDIEDRFFRVMLSANRRVGLTSDPFDTRTNRFVLTRHVADLFRRPIARRSDGDLFSDECQANIGKAPPGSDVVLYLPAREGKLRLPSDSMSICASLFISTQVCLLVL